MKLALVVGLVAAQAILLPAPAPHSDSTERRAQLQPPSAPLLVEPPDAADAADLAADCPGQSPVYIERLPRGGMRYCGVIDADGVRRARALVRSGDRRLVITSLGGTLSAPLDLAELVLDYQLDVEIAGPCFSGCASLVFMAGTRRFISPTGVLGFHNSAASALLMAERQFGRRRGSSFAALQARAAAEWALYARLGIDPNLLMVPQIMVDTLCVDLLPIRTPQGESIVDIVAAFDVWVPETESLSDFGVAVVADQTRQGDDPYDRLYAYYGDQPPDFALNTGAAPALPDGPARTLYAVPRC